MPFQKKNQSNETNGATETKSTEGAKTPAPIVDESATTAEVVFEVPAQKRRIYKCLHSGGYKLPVMVKDEDATSKRYIQFKDNMYMTEDAKEVEALDKIIADEQKLKVPIARRRVLTEDEFIEYTTPEKLYLEIDGVNVHISDLRTAYRFAKEKGMSFVEKERFVINKPKSRIKQGATAGNTEGI